MLESSTNGARAADEEAAAGREDQLGVAELGFGAGGRAAREGAPGPGAVPDPELVEQAKRRSFTAEYKARILAEADACTRPGEVGELLRREGLYTSHLTYWRKQRKDGALKELGKPRGRKPADNRDAQIAALTRRAERAEAELAKMKRVVEIQGKCAARRPVVSPVQPGGTRRNVLGSNGFTRIRKVNGTIACQESDGQAQVPG